MKTRFSKILAIGCCVAVLCTMFSGFVSAHTFETEGYLYAPHGAEPVVENYQWETVNTVVSTEQTAKYFIIHAQTETHSEDLYLSFPEKEGGFRLQSKHEYQETLEVSNVGLFEPDVAVIDYPEEPTNPLVMKGSDGTIVEYSEYEEASQRKFTLVVKKGTEWIISIGSGQIHFGYSTKWLNKDEIVATMVEMPMNYENEAIYNGSQRYCDTNVVGEHFSLTNNDCFSVEDYAYGNIPLFHSNRGYSIWFNMTYPGEANFGCEDDDTISKEKYSITFYGDKLDFFLWTGEPLENLKKYTKITGTSGMTEEWTFGFWTGAAGSAWRGGEGGTQAQTNLKNLLNGYKTRYGFYPEAVYSEGAFADEESAAYLAERNIRNLDWVWTKSESFSTRLQEISKMPVKENGKWTSTGWPLPFSEMGLKFGNYYVHINSQYADASNPSFITYLQNSFLPKWNIGTSGSMLDMNESMSFSGVAWNGLSSIEMHNFNSYYYAKYARELWEENSVGQYKNDFVLFQRSAAAGTQYYVSNFQGDQDSTWAGFKAAIRDMISRSAGGFNLLGADLGGLGGTPSNDLWNRWVVFSVFQPYMRQHGSVIHEPWFHGTVATNNFGKYYYLRKNIVPSIMDAAMQANRTSKPIVKGMMMAYPNDRTLKDIDNQYLFCDDFLVCAVTGGAQEQDGQYYLNVNLPAGNTWYNFFTYEALAGRTEQYTVDAPNNWMPVYLKDGSVKAINLPDSMELMDDESQQQPEHASLLITPPDAQRKTVIYNKDGLSEDFRTYDYTTETYVSTPVNGSTFTVTNKEKEGSSRQIVLALGVAASAVQVDGVDLQRREKEALNGEQHGYHVDVDGLTTIYLPEKWTELTVVKGDAAYEKLNINDVKYKYTTWSQLKDGDITTGVVTPAKDEYFTIDLGSSQNIGRVTLKWLANYMTGYTISVSNNIFDAGTTYKTVTDGDGGIDEWDISATGQYIRITTTSEGTTALAEVEVYGANQYTDVSSAIPVKTDEVSSICPPHDYGNTNGDTCINCGYVRTTVMESVSNGRYVATVQTENGQEIKVGSLLFTNMKGEKIVPDRVGFQQELDTVAEYTVPDRYDDEGIEVTYETISPTLQNPNIGNIGTSIPESDDAQMRFVSRFTRVQENGNEYLVMADGNRYLIKDYGVVLASKPGLDTTSELTTEQAMVLNSANRYVQSVSVMDQQIFYDLCNAYVDMAVVITGIDRLDAEDVDFYSRPYVTVEISDGQEQTLYGDCTYDMYSDRAGK